MVEAVRSSAAGRAGFTLIEMLVALAVFALAAMALLNLSGEATRSAVRLEARTLAGSSPKTWRPRPCCVQPADR